MDIDKISALDLTPGAIIPRYKVEELLGFRYKDDPDQYGFKVLELIEVVEQLASVMAGDRQCRAVTHKKGVRILRTEEISVYFDRQQDQIRRRLKKSLKYLDYQNTSTLTKEEKDALRATRQRAHYLVQGIEATMKKYPMPEPKSLPQPKLTSFKGRKRFV